MPGRPAAADLAVVLALSLGWNLAWMARNDAPWDWDPSYYFAVARNLAEGRGAVTDALWNLGWLPPALTHPADLHWMPLPSRWTALFLALPLPDWRAAQVGAAVAGAGWGALGWAWGRSLGLDRALAVLAGLVAGSGGGWVGYLSIPDSIAVFGLVGGAALWCAANGRLAPAVVACALAAVTRSDGMLLSLACALGFRGPRRLLVAAIGPLAQAAWLGRNLWVAPDGALAVRAHAVHALSPADWLTPGALPDADAVERLAFLADHAGAIVRTWVVGPLGVGLPLLLWGAWRAPDRGRLAGVAATFLLLPPTLYLLAPSVAFEGSAFRSLSATWPALSALLVLGAARLTTRYPPAFLPACALGLLLALEVAAGRAPGRFPAPLDDCGALADAPPGAAVLSYDPLGVAARCGRPGVILGADWSPDLVRDLADRYRIDWLLAAPDGYESWTMEAGAVAVPGWTRVGERVWRRDGAEAR